MAVGLDIGSSAVRAVQLAPQRGGPPRLGPHGEVALPPGAVVDGDVVEPAVVAEALRRLWDGARLRDKKVAVGLASPRVTVRQLDLPELADAELGDAVRLQAEDQLPIPVEQALLDHLVIERYPVGEGRRNVRLLLVAADQEMVDRLLAAITAAKLRPVVVDLDAFALIRSLAGGSASGDEVELVVDVGAAVTKIAVHRGGNPLFVRMVALGGQVTTRALQEALDLDWEGAEAAKLRASTAMAAGVDLDPDDERARMLHDGVQRVLREVRRSFDFFRGQHEDVPVHRVILCGGASAVPALAEQLASALELPVDRCSPQGVLDAAEPTGALGAGGSLAVAVGLALGASR